MIPVDRWESDLPDRIGASLAREIRQCCRRWSFIAPFLICQVLALLAIVREFRGEPMVGTTMATLLVADASGRWELWTIALVICVVLIPLSSLEIMREELRDGNHELLALSGISSRRVVAGKFFARVGLSILVLISLLPYSVVRMAAGTAEWWDELAVLLSLAALSSLATAIAISASSSPTWSGRFGNAAVLGSGSVIALLMLGAVARFSSSAHLQILVVANLAIFCGSVSWGMLECARLALRVPDHPQSVSARAMMGFFAILIPIATVFGMGVTLGRGAALGPLVSAIMLWRIIGRDSVSGAVKARLIRELQEQKFAPQVPIAGPLLPRAMPPPLPGSTPPPLP